MHLKISYICKFLLKIGIFLFSTFPIFAQSDFRKGYVVMSKGDTIDGWIDYRGNIRLSNVCSFKLNKNSPQQNFDHTQIVGFGFNKTRYFISSQYLPQHVFYSGFVEILIQGSTSLLFGRDYYYIFSTDSSVTQLINPTKKIISSAGEAYISSDKYKYQLEQLLTDCTELSSYDFKKTSNDHRSLIKLIHHYNQCMEQPSKIVNHELKMLESWVIFGAEFEFRRLEFSSNSNSFRGLTNPIISPSQQISPKLSILSQLPFINKRINLGFELSYFNEEYSANYEDLISTTLGRRYSSFINYSYIKSIFLLRYTIPANKVSYFAEFGVVARFIQNPTSLLLVEEQNQSTILISKEKELPFSTVEIGIMGGIGMYYNLNSGKKIFVCGRIDFGNGVIKNDEDIISKSNTLSLNSGLLLPILRNRER